MQNIDTFTLISFISSLASLILAIVAILFARSSEKESRENYDKTKDVLAQIDKRSAIIETTVQKSQEQLLNTFTRIIDETIIPKKVDPKSLLFLKMMNENPEMQKMIIEKFGDHLKNKEIKPNKTLNADG